MRSGYRKLRGLNKTVRLKKMTTTRRTAGLVCTLALLLPILAFLGFRGYDAWKERDYLRVTDAEFRKRVQVGMSQNDVHAQLGPPSERSDDDFLWIYKNRQPGDSGHDPTFFSIRFQGESVWSIGSTTLRAYETGSEQGAADQLPARAESKAE